MTTGIRGVELRALDRHDDDRGSFLETYRREWLGEGREMLQSNLSRSRAGVLRGPHFHRLQADYWVVVEGRAFVGLLDLRADSPSEGRRAELTLEADAPAGLSIPPGIAHGFVALTDVTLLYLVDAYHDGTDEFGIAWDDPELGIGWPLEAPILSERDRRNPSLAEVLRDPPRTRPAV